MSDDLPPAALPLVPSLIRSLYPHAYTTIGGAPITERHIQTVRSLTSRTGLVWHAGAMLRTPRPLPPFVLAACDLVEAD